MTTMMKRMFSPAALATVGGLATLATATAGNWPGLRGPHQDGSGDDSMKLPAEFSPTENVAWSTDLPGPSAGSPCVWGDRVFVTAAVEDTKALKALCLDAGSGEIVWEREVAQGFSLDPRSNLASPSPATDGKHVAFFFGTGDLAVFDFQGEQLWSTNLVGSRDYYFAFQWTFSTSPLIHDGMLVMQVLQRDTSFNFADFQRGEPGREDNPSYLVAFDIANGSELWRVERPSKAVAESREAFTSPVIAEVDGKEQLLVAGGDAISGHDPGTGRELWRWGTWNPDRISHWRLVPSPVAGKGIALACAPKGDPIYAVSMRTGELAWKSEAKEVSSDVCTPLFYRGHFYVLNGEFKDKRLSCIDPETGKVLWTGEIGAGVKIECSPTAADGKIYFLDHNGTVYVVDADPTDFKLLHSVPFGSRAVKDLRSTIALADDSLFIRTHDKLFRIGKKGS